MFIIVSTVKKLWQSHFCHRFYYFLFNGPFFWAIRPIIYMLFESPCYKSTCCFVDQNITKL